MYQMLLLFPLHKSYKPARKVPTSVQSQKMTVMKILDKTTREYSPQSSRHSQLHPARQHVSIHPNHPGTPSSILQYNMRVFTPITQALPAPSCHNSHRLVYIVIFYFQVLAFWSRMSPMPSAMPTGVSASVLLTSLISYLFIFATTNL